MNQQTTFTGDSGLRLEVRRSFGYDDEWQVSMLPPESNMWTVMPVRFIERGAAEACAVELLQMFDTLAAAQHVRDEERYAEMKQRLDERAVESKAAAAKQRKRAKAAPVVEAWECPGCGDVTDDAEDWEVAAYECGGCGHSFRGEDGNRCEQCNKFAARVDECSCPSCGEPGLPEPVKARSLDGSLIVLDGDQEAKPPSVAKRQTLAEAASKL